MWIGSTQVFTHGFKMSDALYLPSGKSLKSNSDNWYRIIQTLGAGGNAVTYLVICTSGANKGVMFALKIFRRLSKPERRARFLEEVAFLKDVSHPSIMRVFDEGDFTYTVAGTRNDYPFVIAEYLPRTLYDVIRSGSLRTVQKLSVSVQLLSALAHLEAMDPQAVHRDIKPQNIFIKGQSCVLGDFGLMKLLDDHEEEDREVFKESVGVGMPFFYRTPDLVAYAKNEAPLSVATDVFQLGLVLTELFTGRNPCRRPPGNNMLSDIELEPIGTIGGELSGAIASLLNRMLILDSATREKASALMDPWMGVLDSATSSAVNLDGHAF